MPADKCGVWWVKVFHLYGGGFRKSSTVGDFIKVSVRVTRPENWLAKKSKTKSIIIRVRQALVRRDGTKVVFRENSTVLLKKRLTPRGKELNGPLSNFIKRKRFSSSFPGRV